MADKTDEDVRSEKDQRKVDRGAQAKAAVANARTRVAQVVWLACVVAALVLGIGALCIALKANADNGLVTFVKDTADRLDLGVFSRKHGVAHFSGHDHSATTKNALVNWGLAAAVWLVAGRILDKVVRP